MTQDDIETFEKVLGICRLNGVQHFECPAFKFGLQYSVFPPLEASQPEVAPEVAEVAEGAKEPTDEELLLWSATK